MCSRLREYGCSARGCSGARPPAVQRALLLAAYGIVYAPPKCYCIHLPHVLSSVHASTWFRNCISMSFVALAVFTAAYLPPCNLQLLQPSPCMPN